MKRYLLILLLPAALVSCDVKKRDRISDEAARERESGLKDSTTVSIIDSVYNFPKATEGDKVEYKFRFKNTGIKPLIIVNVSATCGCTIPEKPELPVLPGDTGFIKVVFNTTNKVGQNEKRITVISNARPEFKPLILAGEVVKKQ